MDPSPVYPVDILYRPAAFLRMRPRTRGNYTRQFNRVYAEAHGIGLVMDVFQPASPSGQAVVDVVSGGWYSDRIGLNEHIGFGIIDALCDRGITVFAVSPGSLTLFTGFDMVRHVHAAVRHIRYSASEFGIDPERLGIMGVSAGGHLASLTALSPKKGRARTHVPWRQFPTDVAAAAVFFPPTDLVEYSGARFDTFQIEGIDPGRLLFTDGLEGKSEAEIVERLTTLSPARVAIVDPPPFMIVHGKADPIVPWEQSEKLAAALRAAGGTVDVVYKDTGGHVWPDIQREVTQVAGWLADNLKDPASRSK